MQDGDDYRNIDGIRHMPIRSPYSVYLAGDVPSRSMSNPKGKAMAGTAAQSQTYFAKNEDGAQNSLSGTCAAVCDSAAGFGDRLEQQEQESGDTADSLALSFERASFGPQIVGDRDAAPSAQGRSDWSPAPKTSMKPPPAQEKGPSMETGRVPHSFGETPGSVNPVLTSRRGGQLPGGLPMVLQPLHGRMSQFPSLLGPCSDQSVSRFSPVNDHTVLPDVLDTVQNHDLSSSWPSVRNSEAERRRERQSELYQREFQRIQEKARAEAEADSARDAEEKRPIHEKTEPAERVAREWRIGAEQTEVRQMIHEWFPHYQKMAQNDPWVSRLYQELQEVDSILFFRLKAAKDSRTKPSFTPFECVVLALVAAPDRCATPQDILAWVMGCFPWYGLLDLRESQRFMKQIEVECASDTNTKLGDGHLRRVYFKHVSTNPPNLAKQRTCCVYNLPPGVENFVFEQIYTGKFPHFWRHVPSEGGSTNFLNIPLELRLEVYKHLRLSGVVHVAYPEGYMHGNIPRLFLEKPSSGCYIINDGLLEYTRADLLPTIKNLLPLVHGNETLYEEGCEEFFCHHTIVIHERRHQRGFFGRHLVSRRPELSRPSAQEISAPFLAYNFLKGIGRVGRHFLGHVEFSMTGSSTQEQYLGHMLELLGESICLRQLAVTIDTASMRFIYRSRLQDMPGLSHLQRFRGLSEVDIKLTDRFDALRDHLDQNIIPLMKTSKNDKNSCALH
ncbi:hypothetical protein K491DRAFT_756082 [Lophiostoma macrostomum CBS 122681]|uniref:Uncharacterized protein n=1 Tax=Lophiostoma macrostomum CBS 122681 TaxID=1314788 RepID=A0A6A6TI38_9PLEO|nr:hypothetical protein K491DRAFT_756082 [Lophiostoma macrostomum CBS 122681]